MELVVASQSRTSGHETWTCGQRDIGGAGPDQDASFMHNAIMKILGAASDTGARGKHAWQIGRGVTVCVRSTDDSLCLLLYVTNTLDMDCVLYKTWLSQTRSPGITRSRPYVFAIISCVISSSLVITA